MEKKLNQKYAAWLSGFKTAMRDNIMEHDQLPKQIQIKLLECIYNYPPFVITNEDLQKRKRVKNVVPYHERCCALRADSLQCTRRRKGDNTFCGTHMKGIPHGEIHNQNAQNTTQKIQIWAEEVEGIISHLDKFGNVYDPQDVYQNITNPRIIAKYTKKDDTYTFQNV
tara:strand:- start:1336 stop:1839 length:504 start_codon:yes stop_codon:yes gene_type:complete